MSESIPPEFDPAHPLLRPLFDSHCHPAFAADPQGLLVELRRLRVGVCACTVSPQEYCCLAGLLEARQRPAAQVAAQVAGQAVGRAVGLGFHPWLVAQGELGNSDLEKFAQLLPQVSVVGEVGLDFSPKYKGARDAQLRAFKEIARLLAGEASCAQTEAPHAPGGASWTQGEASQSARVVSLHLVKSYGTALEILAKTGALEGSWTFVAHGFVGSADLAQQLVRAGLYVGIGPRSLASESTVQALVQVPANRILFETDLPARASAVDMACSRNGAGGLDGHRTSAQDLAWDQHRCPAQDQARNQSRVLLNVIGRCAQVRQVSLSEMLDIAANNVLRVFGAQASGNVNNL